MTNAVFRNNITNINLHVDISERSWTRTVEL